MNAAAPATASAAAAVAASARTRVTRGRVGGIVMLLRLVAGVGAPRLKPTTALARTGRVRPPLNPRSPADRRPSPTPDGLLTFTTVRTSESRAAQRRHNPGRTKPRAPVETWGPNAVGRIGSSETVSGPWRAKCPREAGWGCSQPGLKLSIDAVVFVGRTVRAGPFHSQASWAGMVSISTTTNRCAAATSHDRRRRLAGHDPAGGVLARAGPRRSRGTSPRPAPSVLKTSLDRIETFSDPRVIDVLMSSPVGERSRADAGAWASSG